MSFGSPDNPYGQPQNPQQGYGYPQQGQPGYPQQGQPGYGHPQAPQGGGVPPQGYPQQGQPGYGYPPQGQPDYGYPQQPGYGGQPPYANWGQRFLAILVDGLVICVPYVLVILGREVQVLALIGLIGVLGVAIWMLVQEGQTGQTIGKKTLGIRLVRESDGQPPGVGMALVRRLAHFLDSLPCYVGWLWPAWDSKKQTFADKVCSTIVIRTQ